MTIKLARAQLRQALRDLRDHDKTARRERGTRAAELRAKLAGIRAEYRHRIEERASQLATARDHFRAWWDAVKAERAKRRRAISRLRDEVRELRKKSPAVRTKAKGMARKWLSTRRADDAVKRERKRKGLTAAVDDARDQLARAHQQSTRTTGARKGGKRAAERSAEFDDATLQNLPPEQAGWFVSHRRAPWVRALRRRAGMTPDRLAEAISEHFEANPDELLGHLEQLTERAISRLESREEPF